MTHIFFTPETAAEWRKRVNELEDRGRVSTVHVWRRGVFTLARSSAWGLPIAMARYALEAEAHG